MLSGIKIIPRDQIDKEENENSNVKKKNNSSKKEKHKRKKKSSEYSGSSGDDLERIEKGSRRRKKKWYSSEENSDESEGEGSSDSDGKRHRRKDKKQSRRKKKRYSSSSSSEDYSSKDKDRRRSSGAGKKKDDGRESSSLKEKEIERKEMGLEWMLRPASNHDKKPSEPVELLEEPPTDEIKTHPREMNPYMKDNGTGYPEEADEKKAGVDRLLSSSVVGDGGASWRLKSLKRAEEQAAREGRSIEEVVLERWGSLDILSEYGASRRAAAPRAHLHAIRNRKQQNVDNRSIYVVHDVSVRKGKDDDDSDKHLAQRIMQNKNFSVSGQADDEYDYEDGPSKKSQKKGGESNQKASGNNHLARRILTQQERCLFCFENPKRPKHLVVAIANFTYLMLPQWEPVVPGHCCILPMQHESATRTIDNNVWDEIRNFKKCLIMMFAKQDKEMVFLETVMGLAQQRRHCLIECIPVPLEIAKQAPVYFKKAIDEAEDEWSQHNAKKLIDTSEKGLRGSIPKNFPYFHVEFGLKKGFVHVIDDESKFDSSIGLNVIRGMLQLPEEDMYRRRRHQPVEEQKQTVSSFARDWEPFDWTKQLD